VYAWAAILIHRRKRVGPGRSLVVGGAAAYALDQLQYMVLLATDPRSTWLVYLNYFDLLAHVTIGLGLLIVLLERQNDRAAAAVHELRAGEESLRQAQKMEALGRLAGGVSHDFSNMLTAIRGYVDLLITEDPPPDVRRRDLEQVARAVDRAAALTHQLLTFSRRQRISPRVIDVNAVILDMLGMLRRLIGDSVMLETKLCVDSVRVRVDQSQLEQVLLNLAINARDAMPSGGRLTIRTLIASAPAGDVPEANEDHAEEVHPYWVTISVEDNGRGMDAATRAHVFEPFFTTKPQGHGTGLGLATVYGIVRRSGGTILCSSAQGKGTTFTLSLPGTQAQDSDPEAQAPSHPSGEAHTATTILLVEDEHLVRELVARLLKERGYRVIEAADAVIALAALQGHTGRIHLIITDVVMPKLSGPQLSERLIRRYPGVKVLYISGYTGDSLFSHGLREEDVHLLHKPFTRDALLSKVEAMLQA
jgi:signal transduction histidine kinase